MIRRRRRRTADFSDFLTRHAVRSDSFLTKTKEQIKAEIFLLREKRGGREEEEREMENSSVLRYSTAQVKSNGHPQMLHASATATDSPKV